MKKLSLNEMQGVQGGINCGTASKTATVMGTIGFALGVAALFTPVGAVATVFLVSQATVFGGVGVLTDWSSRAAGC